MKKTVLAFAGFMFSTLLLATKAEAKTDYQTMYEREVIIQNYIDLTEERKEELLLEEVELGTEIFECYSDKEETVNKRKKNKHYFEILTKDGYDQFLAKKVNQKVWTTTNVNLRKGPNIKSKIITTLSTSTEVKRVGVSATGWSIVKYKNKKYFMVSKYLSKKKPEVTSSWTEHNKTVTLSGEKGSYLGTFQLTAYDASEGGWGHATASGAYATAGKTVACNSIPMGTKIYIEGYGYYIVEDTGGMGNNVIDVFMNSHSETTNFGRKFGVKVYRA